MQPFPSHSCSPQLSAPREGKPLCVCVYTHVCAYGWGWEWNRRKGGRLLSWVGGLAFWHPGGVFLLNCLSSTAVIANEKLKSTLTPAPTPAPVAHKCSLSTLLLEKHPAENAVDTQSAPSPLQGQAGATAGRGGGSGPQRPCSCSGFLDGPNYFIYPAS